MIDLRYQQWFAKIWLGTEERGYTEHGSAAFAVEEDASESTIDSWIMVRIVRR